MTYIDSITAYHSANAIGTGFFLLDCSFFGCE